MVFAVKNLQIQPFSLLMKICRITSRLESALLESFRLMVDDWISSFLKRRQLVCCYSRKVNNLRVRQGSVLDPILFLHLINNYITLFNDEFWYCICG